MRVWRWTAASNTLASTEERAQGDWEKGVNKERRPGKEEWVLSQTLDVFQRQYLRTGAQKNHVLTRIWWDKASGICPTQRTRIRGEKKQASFHIFLEVAKRWDERGEDKTLNKLRVEVMLGNKEATRRDVEEENRYCQDA